MCVGFVFNGLAMVKKKAFYSNEHSFLISVMHKIKFSWVYHVLGHCLCETKSGF